MSDSDDNNLKVNESFAKSYNRYRQKEELQRLKDKYGHEEDSSSESESEDEEASEITASLEKDFFKTLSYLKKDDPTIYDKNAKFFQDNYKEEESENEKEEKTKPMFMKDYERKVITEKEGKFVEDEESDEEIPIRDVGYYQQQRKLKKELRQAIEENLLDEEDDEILVKKSRQRVIEMPETDYKSWLGGDKVISSNEDEDVGELKSLKEYWTDKKLDDGEKFLRDYFLKKKYIDPKDDVNLPTEIPTVGLYKEDSDEEEFEETQETFEHKYNFRFEEPDKDFIKSYPRTVRGSVRKPDDSRKKKRDIQKVKDEEKNRKKREELNELKRLKRREILNKIEQLRETTGNHDINFKDEDVEEEFDPQKYDDRMKELFNEEFYEEDGDDEKPVFSDMEEDEMGEYDPHWNQYADEEYGAAAENPDFNMDCDYNPEEHEKQKEEKKRIKNPTNTDKKKRKKSAFFESVSKEKPIFDPANKTFEEYLDEYYSLDYEDLIGDLPCRFKYRKVLSNNFGLSTDEILQAKDSELNAWCSLKRAVQYRSQEEERQDKVKYSIKGRNMRKKANILRSVYKTEENEETEDAQEEEEINKSSLSKAQKRRLRKKQKMKKLKNAIDVSENEVQEECKNTPVIKREEINKQTNGETRTEKVEQHKKKRGIKRKATSGNEQFQKVAKIPATRLEAYGLNPKKFLNKMKYAKT